mmetsp:Transcript_44639/g.131781  ORF Transcript_44639/g.131781 Transcript_44639/m.131781 type:complete len:248 (-) Transcript_44639:194-937(-)
MPRHIRDRRPLRGAVAVGVVRFSRALRRVRPGGVADGPRLARLHARPHRWLLPPARVHRALQPREDGDRLPLLLARPLCTRRQLAPYGDRAPSLRLHRRAAAHVRREPHPSHVPVAPHQAHAARAHGRFPVALHPLWPDWPRHRAGHRRLCVRLGVRLVSRLRRKYVRRRLVHQPLPHAAGDLFEVWRDLRHLLRQDGRSAQGGGQGAGQGPHLSRVEVKAEANTRLPWRGRPLLWCLPLGMHPRCR